MPGLQPKAYVQLVMATSIGGHYCLARKRIIKRKKNIIYCTQKKYQCQGFHFAPEKLKALKSGEDITKGLGTFASCGRVYFHWNVCTAFVSILKSSPT